MKLSVSLAEEDVDFLDEYAERGGYRSRSAVVQRAVELLRTEELGSAYAEAFDEWAESDDAQLWDETTSDGLSSAAR